jgi:hypothetical protein
LLHGSGCRAPRPPARATARARSVLQPRAAPRRSRASEEVVGRRARAKERPSLASLAFLGVPWCPWRSLAVLGVPHRAVPHSTARIRHCG